MNQRTPENQEIIEAIESYENWYHQIELAPGIVTPGINDSARVLKTLDEMGLPARADGLSVLDIGCRDGYFAFEMERRGAKVTGIDYAAPEITGFSIAASVLESKVNYRVENVYDLDPEKLGQFDIILFLGVLYHLRNPLLALDRIRKVLQPDGLLFVETELCTDDRLNDCDAPVWQYYPDDTLNQDDSNKWAPNFSGLKTVIADCQFELLFDQKKVHRGFVTARAIVDKRKAFFTRLDSSRDLYGRGELKKILLEESNKTAD